MLISPPLSFTIYPGAVSDLFGRVPCTSRIYYQNIILINRLKRHNLVNLSINFVV
jgi:hypothetical protein